MDTLAEIRVALNAASLRIEHGLAHADTHRFLDELWSSIYESAPVDLQPYVWSRLIDLGDLLGVDMPGHLPVSRQPPSTHYRV